MRSQYRQPDSTPPGEPERGDAAQASRGQALAKQTSGPAGVGLAAALLVAGIVVAGPFLMMVRGAMLNPGETTSPAAAPVSLKSWTTIAATFGVPALIGMLSAVWAWPVIWSLGVARRRGFGLLGIGMLLPPALAYAGWGVARAPGTVLGNALERAAEAGWPELVTLAGQGLAVVGLSLWAAPLAAGVGMLTVRDIDASVVDAARLDAPTRRARWMLGARLTRRGVLAGAAAVCIVMLGSPIPLHLAQIPTLAVGLWQMLDQTPREQWWRVWWEAWPLLLAAVVVALGVGRWAAPTRGTGVEPTWIEPPPGRGVSRWVWVLLALGTVVPSAILATSIRSATAWRSVWEVSSAALGTSLVLAIITGLFASALALAFFAALCGGAWSRLLARLGLGIFAAAAVSPGAMIGAMLLLGCDTVSPLIAESPAIVVLAHLARFGIVPALVGFWLARADTGRELRVLDGAVSGRGFIEAAGVMVVPGALVAGVVVGALSLQEIEAGVVVQPPGVASFARQLLNHLHFSRLDELAICLLTLVGFGLLAGCVGLAIAGIGRIGRSFSGR
jgi:ABC-type Fe3+ transport system permease subunit